MTVPSKPDSEALTNFQKSLKEVEFLCSAAEEVEANEEKYSTFNKAALLLIAGKFETFAESAVEEFIFTVNDFSLKGTQIPEWLKLEHTFNALQDLDTLKLPHKSNDALNLFKKIGNLWGSDNEFNNISVCCSFSYGKHGHAELRKLFARVGIPDVFQVVKITHVVETVSGPINEVIDFRGSFNSVTSMRNNILHEDASPSLNTSSIREYCRHFENFARELDRHLSCLLNQMRS